jgi:hypothetical protein
MSSPTVRVGQLRPSQLLWAFGVGSLIDLPRTSMVVLGLDEWDTSRCVPLNEARLLEGVRMKLGHQVARLLSPPVPPEGRRFDPYSEDARIGVPVAPFPGWLRCPFCHLLAEWQSGLFRLEPDLYRMDRTVFRHENCPKARRPIAVPTRFLVACRDGHLDDFPWRWFVHGGPSDCTGRLEFFEVRASLETRDLRVKCVGCDAQKTMADAFGESGGKTLPACRGRHPHLRHSTESCDRQLRAVLLGASNSWFPVTMSVLSIPAAAGKIPQLVADLWAQFEDVESREVLKVVLKVLKKEGKLPNATEEDRDAFWREIEAVRASQEGDRAVEGEEPDFKTPEWEVLTKENPPREHPDFLVTPEPPPDEYRAWFSRVVLAEKLREVNALIGFTRVDPPDEGEGDEAPQRAPLARSRPSWVPATEVRGEGLFLQLDLGRVNRWLARKEVHEREALLRLGHRSWRAARGLRPIEGRFPGVLFAMIHTFSHLLLKELALECGYGASSIRERIYASEPGEDAEMAGLLLYTAAPDSDGTLGGLVSLGKAENLSRLIGQALERARICSSDPLCSEHAPSGDRSLHGAACHACAFASETSCEAGNRYLDRSLVVNTVSSSGVAYFGGP